MVIKHSLLDSAAYIITKAETPDPSITTSATAYAKFSRELRAYLAAIMREAVSIDMSLETSAQSALATMEQNLLSIEAALPDVVGDFLLRQADAGMRMGMSQIPLDRQVPVLPEAFDRRLEEGLVRLQRQSRTSLQVAIRDLFGDGLERGESPAELANRVQDWAKRGGDIDRQAKWRATRVARTEASRVLNEGQIAAWEEAGIERMQWLVAPSPCEFCEMMKKKASVGITSSFFSQGDSLVTNTGKRLDFDYAAINGPPLHPNCRCTLVPVIEGLI
tara:strand:+ start:181 stop:1008 length:828 start_codon:yes stop_codon:yes gene_type:complete